HHALGLDSTEYDYQVFRITSEIARQVFPIELDIDDPRFRAGLETLCRISAANESAKAQGGLLGKLKQAGCAVSAAAMFARLYLLPVKRNTVPEQVLMAPAW
ncbi:MAG: magnesium-protoporphyrin IX monomethyl ester (oxidative) cyclase, partial [Burkholderiales bacterium]|nr:magnesium-protoporphyrin IX monomethyl ester (oxidative) cyclase [Burkholderiales bacterium]